jgi:hypothetical protein
MASNDSDSDSEESEFTAAIKEAELLLLQEAEIVVHPEQRVDNRVVWELVGEAG